MNQYGDFGTLASYIDHIKKNVSQHPTTSMLTIDVGDDCQGTAFSEATTPKCALIYDALSKLEIDAATVGNHDLDTSIPYLIQHHREIFKDGLVTTNSFLKQPYINIGSLFKYKTLPNGVRTLMLGFMHTSAQKFKESVVLDPIQVIRDNRI